MSIRLYMLVNRTVVQAVSTEVWGQWWFETADRIVKQTEHDNILVSTVFLGIDLGIDKPAFFETMVFGGFFDGYCQRCATWKEAEQQHEAIFKMVFDKAEYDRAA